MASKNRRHFLGGAPKRVVTPPGTAQDKRDFFWRRFLTQFGAPAKSPTPAKRPFRLYGMAIFANSAGPGPFFFHGPNDMIWAMKKKSPEDP